MSRFNIIKKSRKKSKDIDEKIEYLDKECQKTGLQEFMTTSNIYQGTTKVSNQDYSAFQALNVNGYGLALSGADGNSIGGASVENHLGVNGVAMSPPHPVTGVRHQALHVRDGLGGTTPLRPGAVIKRGFADNAPDYTMGSAIWFYFPTHNNGEGVPPGRWCNFEYGNFENNSGWGFWDTIKTGQFAGIHVFNTTTSQHPCGDIDLATKIASINFGENGTVGAPQTTVLTQKDLGDPGHLPINLKDFSKQAFDWLLGKAQEALDFMKGNFDSNMDGMMEKMKEHWEKVIQQGADFGEDVQEFIDDKKEDLAELGKAAEVYTDYLAGNLNDGDIDNDYLGQDYVDDAFTKAFINDNGTVSVGDNVIGSGGKPEYNPKTGIVTIPFEYDFDTNEEQIMKDPNKYDPRNSIVTAAGMVSAWILGGKYGLDSTPVPFAGYATWLSKTMGKGKPTTGHGITMPIEEVKEKNPNFYNYIIQNKIGVSESYISESAKLGHFEPEILNVDINDIRKGIMPEFPKNPPPEMIDGYSAKSKLIPKKVEIPHFIKVTRKDLAQNHKLTDKEIQEFLDDIKMINDYIKKNPAEMIYAMTRYPKDDPRLAQLNFKMDEMKRASDQYVETHFPENVSLFNKLQNKIRQNIEMTDPKNFTGHAEAPKFIQTDITEQEKRRKTIIRHFRKKK